MNYNRFGQILEDESEGKNLFFAAMKAMYTRNQSKHQQATNNEEQNLYSVLGVDKTVSREEIKAAFHEKAKQHHPDRADGDKKEFQKIIAAWDILGNERRRDVYDSQGYKAALSLQEEVRDYEGVHEREVKHILEDPVEIDISKPRVFSISSKLSGRDDIVHHGAFRSSAWDEHDDNQVDKLSASSLLRASMEFESRLVTLRKDAEIKRINEENERLAWKARQEATVAHNRATAGVMEFNEFCFNSSSA
eukprot:m.37550 g.37550  ORF g.37550 m.37550 type:complete len:249 (-) comp9326_c0_seq1:31-777(-)